MNGSLFAAAMWMLMANVLAVIPSRDHHWRRAYVLIAVGVPLAVWVSVQNGLLFGVLFLAAGASILRWPLYYLWRWVRGTRNV